MSVRTSSPAAVDEGSGPPAGILLAGVVPAMATLAGAWKLARDAQLRLAVRRVDGSLPGLTVLHR